MLEEYVYSQFLVNYKYLFYLITHTRLGFISVKLSAQKYISDETLFCISGSIMAGRKKKGSRKGKGSKRSLASQGPSEVALAYHGPIWTRKFRENRNMVVVDLQAEGFLTSSAGGVLNNVYTSSSATWANFGTWAGLYDEFRVLGMQLEFFPNNRYSKVTTTCTPGFGVVDHADSTPLTSYAAALAYASNRVLSIEDPWTDRSEYRGSSVPSLIIRMDGAEEAQWLPTSSTSSYLAIKIYFSGLTASTSYGLFLLRGLVQFRGVG